MNPKKIAYWLVTILMCGLFLYSAQMYFFKTEMVKGFFEMLSFPTWVVIPLAILKVAGVIVVLTDMNIVLREWAYAGFLYDVILATGAHYDAGHGLIGLSFYGIFLVLGSRVLLRYRREVDITAEVSTL
jgi:hypothetical protein